MGLLTKIFNKKKYEYPQSITIVEQYYNSILKDLQHLNSAIALLSQSRSKKQQAEREYLVEVILESVKDLDYLNWLYINRLKNVEDVYNGRDKDSYETDKFMFYDCKEKMQELIENKKQLQIEFEHTHNNFKKIAISIKYKDIPMNLILKQMRTAFNLDGKDHSSNSLKYYDSTSGEIKYINF